MVRILVCVKQAIDVSQLKVDSATRRLITVDAPKKTRWKKPYALKRSLEAKCSQ
jgi:hypothetical protein